MMIVCSLVYAASRKTDPAAIAPASSRCKAARDPVGSETAKNAVSQNAVITVHALIHSWQENGLGACDVSGISLETV